jgi:hypothetical protein
MTTQLNKIGALKFLRLPLLAIIGLSLSVHPVNGQSTKLSPDCSIPFNVAFTSGSLPTVALPVNGFSNTDIGCQSYVLEYTVTATSGSITSVAFQSALGTTAAGSFSNWGGTVSTGTNPSTSNTTATATFTLGCTASSACTVTNSWLRVLITSGTLTGTVRGTLYGWKQGSMGTSEGGDGSSVIVQVNGTTIGTASTIDFQQGTNVTQTGGASGPTVTVTTNASGSGPGGTSIHYIPETFALCSTAGCVSQVAGTMNTILSLNATPTVSGSTSADLGLAIFPPGVSAYAMIPVRLPATWDGSNPTIDVDALVSVPITGQTVTFLAQSACITTGTAVTVGATGALTYNAGTPVSVTLTTSTSVLALQINSLQVPVVGCAAGNMMFIQVARSAGDTYVSNVFGIGANLGIKY